MSQFKQLYKIIPHIDDAFNAFYDAMLNNMRLSVFFDSDEQVKTLIEKQKQHFKSSISMPEAALKKIYIKLGEYHYDLRIPYIDFMKGTEILEEYFLLHTQDIDEETGLMDSIFEYFKLMKGYIAKGYLNRMISEDRRDIEEFFSQSVENKNSYLAEGVIHKKLQWLKKLLESIESHKEFDEKENDYVLDEWFHEIDFLTSEKRKFFEDLEKRIMINTQNLFYFLKRDEYLEILPLYSSILSVYKLTLMLNNAMTIEYANKAIEDMRIDRLTGLLRKDTFEEVLKAEMSMTKRDDEHIFSVCYIDIDDFKSINDNYGHYSGDKVIERIGKVIKSTIRGSDMGFRIGGDEFALILKRATKEQAISVLKKIQTDFSKFEFIFNEEVTFNVNLSIGITEFNSLKKTYDTKELIEEVDEKLYESKRRGKNQIQ